MFYSQAVSGRMHFQEVLAPHVQYMTDRFQEWRKADGVLFKRMWIDGLLEYDKKTGIDWEWQAMDGWMVLLRRHRLGEKSTGPNPTDRAKSGTKRSVLVDGW